MTQREIRVRFWLTEKKQMSKEYTVDELLQGGWYDIGSHITLQWTGLLDKNGVPIYEGDIVTSKWGVRYEVRAGIFADTKSHVQSGFCLFDYEDKLTRGNLGYDIGEETPHEIIGNIYENPDLLK